MKIKQRGLTQGLEEKPIKESIISIAVKASKSYNRTFELWINGDNLSYLTIDEVLDLKDEINEALQEIFK